jgi:hypothetical protein
MELTYLFDRIVIILVTGALFGYKEFIKPLSVGL